MSLRRILFALACLLLPCVLAALAIAAVLFARQGGIEPFRIPHGDRAVATDATTIARGEYLARIGNCRACHTARGGAPFAGGRTFSTGIGTVYSTNITPDPAHGIGDWSADEFAHVMRHGVSRRGALYPVFPYAHFANVADADLDAILAYLRTQPASASTPPPNRLEPPADSRRALVGWRMLHYRPEATRIDPNDRGRYLVDGLGHCAMCHSARGERGSLPPEGHFAGGRIPGIGWYAPPLDRVQLERYSEQQLADYLRTGTSAHGSAYGPMAEVVYASLRALTPDDALAIARHLKQVEPAPLRATVGGEANDDAGSPGAQVYAHACADCHGKDGEGKPGAYPPLQGSVAATAPDATNAVRLVLYGGMPVATAGEPRPHTMPPFVQRLDAGEIAAVVNHLRRRWGARDSRLTAQDVESMQGIVVD